MSFGAHVVNFITGSYGKASSPSSQIPPHPPWCSRCKDIFRASQSSTCRGWAHRSSLSPPLLQTKRDRCGKTSTTERSQPRRRRHEGNRVGQGPQCSAGPHYSLGGARRRGRPERGAPWAWDNPAPTPLPHPLPLPRRRK